MSGSKKSELKHVPTALLVLTLLVGVVFGENPEAFEDLSPDLQQKIVKLKKEYREADLAVVKAWNTAMISDPLLRRAKEGKPTASNALRAASNNLEDAIEKLSEKSPNRRDEIKRWSLHFGSAYADTELLREFVSDPYTRPFVIWGIQSVYRDAPKQDWPKEAQAILANSGANLSDEEAVRLAFAANQARSRKRLDELENRLEGVNLPRKEVRAYRRAYDLNATFSNYISEQKSEAVTNAILKRQEIWNAISSLWSGWGKAYEAEQRGATRMAPSASE